MKQDEIAFYRGCLAPLGEGLRPSRHGKPEVSSNVKWSLAQKKTRRRFAYATAAKADPQIWAKYQRRAKKLKKRPRDVAISDFFKGKNLFAK